MNKFFLPAIFLSVFFFKAQNINTFTGTGETTFCCDGGPSVLAQIYAPHSIAIDGSGNIYFSDGANNRIRKINNFGIITTIAGNGNNGFSGDGGSAALATLNGPTSIAVDPSGNIYFSDSYNNKIRKISTSGIITTIAGVGTSTFSGDGGPAINAGLNQPRGILWQPGGTIYFSDAFNHRIRKIDPSGIITTIAGNGNASYSGDGGQAINAELNIPNSIVMDGSGNLIFCESSNHVIRKVNTGGVISTLAGNGTSGSSGDGGPSTAALLNNPIGIAIDASGILYFSDCINQRIRMIDLSGNISTVGGSGLIGLSGDGGSALSANLYNPKGIALDASGNIYFADNGNNRLRKIVSSTITSIAGSAEPMMNGIPGLALGAEVGTPSALMVKGSRFFLVDQSKRIKVIDSGTMTIFAGNGNTSFTGDNGQAINAGVDPNGIACDAAGNIYITDHSNGRIRKINNAGIISTIAGNGIFGYMGDGGPAISAALSLPSDIKVSTSGDIYFIDQGNSVIRKIHNGIITTYAGNGMTGPFNGDGIPATSAAISPAGLAFDLSGNLIFTDPSNSKIRKINSLGIISTIAGTGVFATSGDGGLATLAELSNPVGIVTDFVGNIYFTNAFSSIRKIDPNGYISTIAGNANLAFSGDGGPAINAQLWNVNTLAVDQNGNLYEGENNRVRAICFSINCLQGIEEKSSSTVEPNIYPNPFNDKITISNLKETQNIQIIDFTGEIVYQSKEIETSEIDLRFLSPGIYFLKIGPKIKKVIKH